MTSTLKGALVALFLCLTACGGGDPEPPPVAGTVELNGDSVMYGLGLQESPAMGLLRERPSWTVEDRSASGLSLRDLMEGYPEPFKDAPISAYPRGPQGPFTAIQHTASVVVIEQGGIDALEETSPEAFEQNLRTAVAHIKGLGATPVLTGIVPLEPGAFFTAPRVALTVELNAITHKVARDLGVTHAGWDTVEFNPATDTLDGIHRTQPASKRLVSRLAAVIDPHLAACRPLPDPCPGLEPYSTKSETLCTKASQ
jgi:hypothetical protein